MKCQAKRAHQGGVGLIEVLIAVLVLSIGFLGVAALEARSLSTNNSAMSRSMAAIASYSIMDAMRADLAAAKAGGYNKTVQASACPASSGGTALADNQLGLWCAQLKSALGAAATTSGTVACDANGACTVTISYDDSRAGWGNLPTQTLVTKGVL